MLHCLRWKRLIARRSWWSCALVGLLLIAAGCDKKPTRGSFFVRIVAITGGAAVVPNASVLINSLRVGKTDDFGVYQGSFRGAVGTHVQIKVVGQGQQNQFTAKVRLRVRKGSKGWRFVPLQIRALLRPNHAAPQQRGLTVNIRPAPMPLQQNTKTQSPVRRPWSGRRVAQAKRKVDDGNDSGTDAPAQRPAQSPGALPSRAKKTRCFQDKRGAHRAVQLFAPPASQLSLIGDCIERVGKIGASGKIVLALPVGEFVRVQATFTSGKSARKVIEVASGATPLSLYFSSGNNKCNLARIRRKLTNRIVLEREEIACLKQEKKGSAQHFSSWLFLGRAYCTNKKWPQGIATLEQLRRDPRNRFNPYRALQLGIEFGRCRQYSKAIPLLKRASQQSHRMAVADRYANQKALHTALYDLYERRYHRRKRPSDLNLSLTHAKRLAEITMSRDPGACRKALKEVKRLKELVNRHGALDQ